MTTTDLPAVPALPTARPTTRAVLADRRRVELRAAPPALLTRFPSPRPAVEPGDVAWRPDANLYGVHALPVAWEAS